MPRGGMPKPTALKLLTGNPGKRDLPVDEPVPPPPNSLEPPSDLSERGRYWWNHYTDFLVPMGLVTAADTSSLVRLCVVDARLDEMDAEYNANGFLVMDDNGNRVVRNITAYTGLYQARSQLMQQFGLTPSSRAKMGHKPVRSEDPFAAFVKKRGRPRKLV